MTTLKQRIEAAKEHYHEMSSISVKDVNVTMSYVIDRIPLAEFNEYCKENSLEITHHNKYGNNLTAYFCIDGYRGMVSLQSVAVKNKAVDFSQFEEAQS